VIEKNVMISFKDFENLEIKIGTVVLAERIEGTDKLLKLEIDLGLEKRQIVAGIGDVYQSDDLIGKQIPVLTNLEPRIIRGIESQGMILAVDVNNAPVLLIPEKRVTDGSVVR